MNKPYLGNEKYIFVSYSHKDKNLVFPIIDKLSNQYRVWFDEGIHFGKEWDKEIVEKLSECFIFVFMVSKNSLESTNCRDELAYARDKGKCFVNIIVEDLELPENFLFRYGRYEMCYLNKYSNISEMINNLSYRTKEFEETKIDSDLIAIDLEEKKKQAEKDLLFERSCTLKELQAEMNFQSNETLIFGSYKWVQKCFGEVLKYKTYLSTHAAIRLWITIKNTYFNFEKLLEIYRASKQKLLEQYINILEVNNPNLLLILKIFDDYFNAIPTDDYHDILPVESGHRELLLSTVVNLLNMVRPIVASEMKRIKK